MRHVRACGWFWLWSLAGALLAFSLVSFVGVLTGLPAVLVLLLVARRSPTWPEPLGLLTGVGALCIAVAALNWGADGLDPAPWLAAGAGLVVLGTVAYGLAGRSSSPYARR